MSFLIVLMKESAFEIPIVLSCRVACHFLLLGLNRSITTDNKLLALFGDG